MLYYQIQYDFSIWTVITLFGAICQTLEISPSKAPKQCDLLCWCLSYKKVNIENSIKIQSWHKTCEVLFSRCASWSQLPSIVKALKHDASSVLEEAARIAGRITVLSSSPTPTSVNVKRVNELLERETKCLVTLSTATDWRRQANLTNLSDVLK